MNLVHIDCLHAEHGFSAGLVDIDQLLDTGLVRIIYHVITQQNRKRFIADKAFGTVNRMTQSQRLLLADRNQVGKFGNAAHLFCHGGFAVGLQGKL